MLDGVLNVCMTEANGLSRLCSISINSEAEPTSNARTPCPVTRSHRPTVIETLTHLLRNVPTHTAPKEITNELRLQARRLNFSSDPRLVEREG